MKIKSDPDKNNIHERILCSLFEKLATGCMHLFITSMGNHTFYRYNILTPLSSSAKNKCFKACQNKMFIKLVDCINSIISGLILPV